MLALASGGCPGADGPVDPEPLVAVDGVVLDASVVRHVAARDGVDDATAQRHATEILQLAAAARAERAATAASDPAPLLTPARRNQLLRAARARLWLDEGFEPSRTPADIPPDAPLLLRALASRRYTHPALHRACQFVVVPNGVTTMDQAQAITVDPQWRARARAVLDPVAQRVQRYIPAGDPEACALMGRLLNTLRPATIDDTLLLRLEAEAGFDLAACAQQADDGTCRQPQFDPQWTARVADTAPGTYTEVFAAGWGLHLVYVTAVEPARDQDDPETAAFVRREVHLPWLIDEFARYLEVLAQQRAVRVAPDLGADPATDPQTDPVPQEPPQ